MAMLPLCVLALLAAFSLRPGLTEETARSSSSRRETSESDDTYPGLENRAEALKLICSKAAQAIYNQLEVEQATKINVWTLDDVAKFDENLQTKPIISTSPISQNYVVLN